MLCINKPLNKWKVRSVTNMGHMFSRCKNFNQPLDKWDVSNVKNMERMFDDCLLFNQPLYEYWNVCSVENDYKMFNGCELLIKMAQIINTNLLHCTYYLYIAWF